jgi:dTDP-4-amino-4,6-dideoxygalactose transaminase
VNVPLLDLVGQYRAIKDEVLPALQAVVESQQFIMGPSVATLEARIAELSHARYGIGCASGTDALVHLYGQMVEMERLLAVASRRGLRIIEDAAQAIGARRSIDGEWRMAGELGWVTGYSFFPSKNLGAWGDGGMMVTSDEPTAERLRKLRLHGGAKQYHHEEVGLNSRLDTLQAAVLLAKLPHLAGWSTRRREHAAYYSRALQDMPGVRPPVTGVGNEHIFHQYTLRVERRDALQAHLKGKGIGTAIYYPIPLHRQPCFAHLGYADGRLPEAERAAREALSLPIFPELTHAQQDYVIDAIGEFYR